MYLILLSNLSGNLHDDGICKHTVATLLEFVNKKEKLIEKDKKNKTFLFELQKKLMDSDKAELIRLLMMSLDYSDNWKSTFLKEFNFKSSGNKSKFTHEIYINQYDDLYSNISSTLQEYSDHGWNDYEDDFEINDWFEEMKDLFAKKLLPDELKKKYIEKMFYYYHLGSSGFEDAILDNIYDIADKNEDWEYIISQLEKKKDHWEINLICGIYKDKLHNDQKYLELKEKNLEHSNDYLDLAEYWLSKNERLKSEKIALEGLKINGGFKTNLLEFLFKFYKLTEPEKSFEHLKLIFEKECTFDNYLRLIKFKSTEAKPEIDLWAINILKSKKNYHPLSKIYKYNANYKELLELVLSVSKSEMGSYSYNSYDEFADFLIDKYPKELIPYYQRLFQANIDKKERQYYAEAAKFGKKLKNIYIKQLNLLDEWKTFISNIRFKYSRSPALLDEFEDL